MRIWRISRGIAGYARRERDERHGLARATGYGYAAAMKPGLSRIARILLPSLIALWAPGMAPADEPTNAVAVEARRVLANVRETAYQHDTEINEKTGCYRVDCSGLASAILRRVSPAALAVVEAADAPFHPRAFAFYEVFAAATTNRAEATNGWMRVMRPDDLAPGDLIAWRKATWKYGETTGHIVIVDADPVRETNGSWRVTVIDATTRPHASDTRPEGTDGVGRGTFWISVDRDGRPEGIRSFSPEDPPRTDLPISMGRFVAPAPGPAAAVSH